MKITIEVVADTRHEAMSLLGDAVKGLKNGKEESGETIHHCIGDYRVIVAEEPDPETPYKAGDRVTCTDKSSAYFGQVGEVLHSGPRSTGVQWPLADKPNIRPNAQLAPAEVTPVLPTDCREGGS